MRRPHTARRDGLVVLVAAVMFSGCGGGGGQLARGNDTTTTTQVGGAREPVSGGAAPVPASTLSTPRSAVTATRELARVETALRAHVKPNSQSDAATEQSRRSLGERQQRAYRALAAHPKWVPEVVAGVPAAIRAAVQANVDAGTALAALTPTGGEAPSSFPAWEILSPEPAATLRSYYDEAERANGIPWAYLAAIHLVETRLGRIRGPSSAGAQGPMQFIPATWASYGQGDINSNHDAIRAAGRYLASRGGPADMDRALFSYNNDDRYVAAVKAYASVLLADPAAFDGYYQWQVFYATRGGVFLLPEGYGMQREKPTGG